MCGLQKDEHVKRESSRSAVWETNESISVIETRHTVADGTKLFCDGAMADDDTVDGCCLVGADKETARCRCDIRWHRRG
jgi:hypothetical protein